MQKRKVCIAVLALLSLLLCLCATACGGHTEHIYDDACDADCNECGELRTVPHRYDHDCDDTCNDCGEKRTVPAHAYDHACDIDCNVCSLTRQTEHVYDGACDMDCNVCAATREVTHTYDHVCDIDCNVCGAPRQTAHVYDHGCDDDCNACGEQRKTQHVYDNDCDTKCNECGRGRAVKHEYDTPCAEECSACGSKRAPFDHKYDGVCDNECNNCGALRGVQEYHVYSTACDEICNVCGATRVAYEAHSILYPCDALCLLCMDCVNAEAHVYESNCSSYCRYCYSPNPNIKHTYDGDGDVDCNVCGATRPLPSACGSAHHFTHDCDDTCNACGVARSVQHAYANACDTACGVCGATRTAEDHVGVARDGVCDVCGLAVAEQEVSAAFVEAFNGFISNVHLMTRGSLFNGNYRFSNIIVSGSAQERYPVPYTEMSFYSNCFAFEQPHMYCTDEDCLAQGYYLQSEYGWYYLEKSEGEWLTLSDMESPYDNFFTHSSLPMLSQKDVLYYPETGTIRISDAYLKRLIFTWCYCGMTTSIQLAENLSINLYDMLPYVSDGTLEAVFSLSENGSLRGLRVELNCTSGQSLYALGYEKQSDGLLAFADWGEMQMRVQLTPGDGCNSVDFTLADRATGDELLTIGAQIYEDIGDFAPSAEMQQYIDMLDRELLIRKTIAERYTGKYKRTSGTCSEIAVYDEEFGYYIYFYEKSGVFQYRGYSPTLTDCCVAEINFMKRTLTPTKHATKEAMDIAMTARYALIVVKPDQPCEAIAVYDEEFDTYALFLLTIEGPYLYAGHTDLPSVLIHFCRGTLNMSNGQLTTQTHIHYFEQEDAE